MGASRIRVSYHREVSGAFFFAMALLLLLSLLSFSRDEVPFYNEPPNPVTNWIGPVGLYAAWGAFMVLGLAAYLVPMLALVGTCLALWARNFRFARFCWLAMFLVVIGAGLADLPRFFWDHLGPLEVWVRENNLDGLGGLAGSQLATFLVTFLGKVGAALILGSAYFWILTFMVRVNPIRLIQETGPWLREVYFQWRLSHAKSEDLLELQKEKLDLEKKRLEREMRRAKWDNAELGPAPALEEEPARREAKIIVAPTPPPPPAVPPPPAGALLGDVPDLDFEGDGLGSNGHGSIQVWDQADDATPAPIPGVPEGEVSGADFSARAGRKDKDKAKAPSKPVKRFPGYKCPPIDVLHPAEPRRGVVTDEAELRSNQDVLLETLREFGIAATAGDITVGPTITRYEIYPGKGVRVERIVALNRNIRRSLCAESVNILAPVPGKDSVAVEIPNPNKILIRLRELLESSVWKGHRGRIPVALGKDIAGHPLVADLADMPHMLIGGTTGSGKSVCINCIVLSLLLRFSPEELRLILIDPKVVEMQCYNDLPHLIVPVVTDPKKVLSAMRWVIVEMEKRYRMMAQAGVRNIAAFNKRTKGKASKRDNQGELELALDDGPEPVRSEPGEAGEPLPDKLPYIVLIVDELADLMQTAPKDVEAAIARLTQKARAAGIHLILATQTPRAQVVTGVIKMNVPCRVAFQVPSALDSRVILDDNGAENLLGRGDMLYLAPGGSKSVRAQGAFVSDEEVSEVVEYIKVRWPASYDVGVQDQIETSEDEESEGACDEEDEEIIERCIEVIVQERKASTSLLQRRLRLGYSRAARIMDVLEQRGIVGPENGAKGREILMEVG